MCSLLKIAIFGHFEAILDDLVNLFGLGDTRGIPGGPLGRLYVDLCRFWLPFGGSFSLENGALFRLVFALGFYVDLY